MPDPFPFEAYLARIGADGPVAATEDVLTRWHFAQATTIPFENLNPLTGRPVPLDPAALASKLLADGRGGYCFELNELLRLALTAAGFRTRALCGRAHLGEGRYALRGHQITLVELAGRPWLADVGFGGNGLLHPIPLEVGSPFPQALDTFRIMADDEFGYRLEHQLRDGWRPLYAFSLDRFLPIDFLALNAFVSRAPESMFTRVPICVRTTPTERRIVAANQFKVRGPDGRATTREIPTAAALRTVLTEELAIRIPADLTLPEPIPAPPGMRDL